jgi:hypothetical protein
MKCCVSAASAALIAGCLFTRCVFSAARASEPHRLSQGADNFVPELRVRVYSIPGVSVSLLKAAEAETDRTFNNVDLRLQWVECTPEIYPSVCAAQPSASELVVRFLRGALPEASERALGISDATTGVAYLFYNRILSLRTHTRLLPVLLGLVMGHEISHLLLPNEPHADIGLMKGQWALDELTFLSSPKLRLERKSIEFMHQEALRRIMQARNGMR